MHVLFLLPGYGVRLLSAWDALVMIELEAVIEVLIGSHSVTDMQMLAGACGPPYRAVAS